MSSFQLTGKWYLIAMSSNSCWATAFSVLPFGVYVNITAMEEANIYEATFSNCCLYCMFASVCASYFIMSFKVIFSFFISFDY